MNSIKVEETHVVNHPFLLKRVKEGKRPGTREFLALLDGAEAGLLIFEHFPNDSSGLVYEICVLKNFRARGVGNQLLLQAETVALDSACKTLILFVRSLDQEFITDKMLMSWYDRKGFIRDVSDSSRMQKTLTEKVTNLG